MATVFFSYSHKDEALRDELEIHLAVLKRQSVIETWHDRRIGAGEEVDHVISEYLEAADIILLLVSSYFIASDYCYDVEMKRALEQHEAGKARVIPVILHPCDWHGLPFGRLMATPTDGKPISKFPNQHDAFLEVTKAIRKAAEEMNSYSAADGVIQPARQVESTQVSRIVPQIRSSNLRVKKTFTDREKDRFLSDAFEYTANFFEGSLAELEARNPEIETEFRRVDAIQFTAAVYVHGSEVSRCRIWLSDKRSFPGGIAYSAGGSFGGNSFNESLSVEDDGYSMFLRSLGMASYGRGEDKKLTFEGASEFYWGMLIERLQR